MSSQESSRRREQSYLVPMSQHRKFVLSDRAIARLLGEVSVESGKDLSILASLFVLWELNAFPSFSHILVTDCALSMHYMNRQDKSFDSPLYIVDLIPFWD